jgi:hypothetical protein
MSITSNEAIDPDNNFHSNIPCTYYNSELFNDEFANLEDKFVIIHQNIRSFNCNIDEFTVFLGTLCVDVDVIILCETWLNKGNVGDIGGFRGYHSCREDKRGGGVSIFVSEKLKSKYNFDLTYVSPVAEFCTVNVSLSPRQSINVVGFYRPPNNSTIEPFCNIIRDDILPSFTSSQMVLLGGDANINLLNNNNVSNMYTNIFLAKYFLPYINLPTRVTGHSISSVDHIWSNIISDVRAGIFTTDITDHFTLFACLLNKKRTVLLL